MITNYTVRNNFNQPQRPMMHQTTPTVSFGSGALVVGAVTFSLLTLINGINGKPMIEQNQKQIAQTSGWEPNTRILASVGQNVISPGTDSVEYSASLLSQLEKEKITTLEQANSSLSQTGYKVERQTKNNTVLNNVRSFIGGEYFTNVAACNKNYFPLQTQGKQLGIFDITKKNENRFVVVFHQAGVALAHQISENFEEKIKEIYDLNDKNIISVGINSPEDFQKGIDSVRKKIDTTNDKSSAELLIFYAGHGGATELQNGNDRIEGAAEGVLKTKLKIKEPQLKELFREKLKDIKTLFIIEACHSGAWISENTKTSTKLNRLA